MDIIHLLKEKGARGCVESLEEALAEADCVVVVTDYSAYDWNVVGEMARLLVDTRRVMNS